VVQYFEITFMRILLLNDRIPPENRGGAGEVLWRLAVALRNTGHEVHVAAATPDQPFTETREGIPTYHLHSRYPERWRATLSLYNPQTVGALGALYDQIKPDVVNAHNIHADLSYASLSLAHRRGIRTVFSTHDVMPFTYAKMRYFIDPTNLSMPAPEEYRLPPFYNLRMMRFRYNPLRNIIIRYILTHHADARTSPSDALARAHAMNGLPPFTTVHNGLDPQQMAASPSAIDRLRERLNLAGRKVILFAGRLTADKGTHQLLAAMQRIVESVPEMMLLVLSSHPIEKQIDQPQYAQLREKHIRSGGWLAGEELAAAYHLADVVVVPSIIFDTFPTINLEAMAAAKPVIATCYGGSSEVVQDGETGYIVNPFDTADFASKLQRLLTDTALAQQMGAAGQRRLEQHFSLQTYTSQMLDVYQGKH
jgi:glycosyltransferase involved in cell wall biosynthesis